MTQKQIMQRLDQLEKQVVDLQRQVQGGPRSKDNRTWRDFIGMFHNDADFKEAMELGAAYRRSTLVKPKRKTRK